MGWGVVQETETHFHLHHAPTVRRTLCFPLGPSPADNKVRPLCPPCRVCSESEWVSWGLASSYSHPCANDQRMTNADRHAPLEEGLTEGDSQLIFGANATSRPVTTVVTILEIDMSFADQIVCSDQIPVEDLYD